MFKHSTTKRMLALVPIASILLPNVVYAASMNTISPLPDQVKTIYYNGKTESAPYGFVHDGTTYMPIWYVMQALNHAGIKNTWDGEHWNIEAPTGTKVSMQNVVVSHAKDMIMLNGQPVSYMNGVTQIDPSSHKMTTFMPIWYVMQALQRMNVHSLWDGSNWYFSNQPIKANTQIKLNNATSTSPQTSVQLLDISNATILPTLKKGDKGAYVYTLETYLNALKYPVGTPMGTFNDIDTIRVRAFQKDHDLPQTGIVDQKTWISIENAYTEPSQPNEPPTVSGNSSTSVNTSTGTKTSSDSNDSIPNNNPDNSTGVTVTSTSTNQSTGNATSSGSNPSVTPSGFTNVDLRYNAPTSMTATAINAFLQKNNAPLTGLGSTYIAAQNKYGSDATYLVAHSILESYWGKSQIAQKKNNLFGYGAYDSAPGQDAGFFPSNEYAIMFQAWEVRNNYLDSGSRLYVSPTLTGMNVHYATDPKWASSIGGLMSQTASSVGETVSSYKQYTSSNVPTQPQSTSEPVFYIDATGTTNKDPYYNGIPYYPNMSDGENTQFFGSLQVGSYGENVVVVQRYVNQQIGTVLALDGQFGPLTESAVKAFQKARGMSQTGVWNASMWDLINPTQPTLLQANQPVQIDQIEMGMANGYVASWYHIKGKGWVISSDIQFTNVYRANVLNPESTNTTIPVYDPSSDKQIASIHSGDFVVSSNPTAQDGKIAITICNQQTGQTINGVIDSSQATLTKQL